MNSVDSVFCGVVCASIQWTLGDFGDERKAEDMALEIYMECCKRFALKSVQESEMEPD